MEYIKKEFKKLSSISCLLVGFFLVVEHIYTYGYISLLDFLGHEWFGIIFIILGLLIGNKKWNSNDGTPLEHAKNKLKYVFSR